MTLLDIAKRIYAGSPEPFRTLFASGRGLYLRSWRYGPESEQLVAEALERDTWTASAWQRWREERLASILHRAATKVPYFRDLWSARRRQGDHRSWEQLENWPLLTKAILREAPQRFIADDCDPRNMFCDTTSGTTGTPLQIYETKPTVRGWFALFEARVRRWHGVSWNDPWAILGGQLVVPIDAQTPPYWVKNLAFHQLYLSTHHLSPRTASDYVKALIKHSSSHMIVYPSSAAVLANAILDQGLEPPPLKAIFSNAEFLSDAHRQTISQAFHCPVRNTYGMSEIVIGASECQNGSLHIWPESGWLEVFGDDLDMPVQNNKSGRFVVTGLFNADMPLIRYLTGDRGSMAVGAQNCACGREFPLLGNIEGRMNDMVVTRDGRRIFWLNPVFYNLPVREGQIIQESVDFIRILYVPAEGFTKNDEFAMKQRLFERVGEMNIEVQALDSIPRADNGKLLSVISHVS